VAPSTPHGGSRNKAAGPFARKLTPFARSEPHAIWLTNACLFKKKQFDILKESLACEGSHGAPVKAAQAVPIVESASKLDRLLEVFTIEQIATAWQVKVSQHPKTHPEEAVMDPYSKAASLFFLRHCESNSLRASDLSPIFPI
jgi:hypothetical protein